jgi:hypothetical protein
LLNTFIIPILYRTGHELFTFSQETRQKLRLYLLNGGTLIFDACCGRRLFVESVLREIEQLIPERSPYRLTLDHPLFHSFFDIKNINYRPWALKAGAQNGDPAIIGVDIECRTAIFFFRWDVSCGWDDQNDSDMHRCLAYDINSAKQIGANLMAYITAERSTAISLSKAFKFIDETKNKAGKFVIAQVKYNGGWKTRSAGLSMLLNSFCEQTKTPVRFMNEEISLDSNKLFEMPFIYLTGHQDFEFTSLERNNLRKFLLQGGVLLVESCCGRETFDYAFKREIAKVLNDKTLEKININNSLFTFPNNIKVIQPRSALAHRLEVNNKIEPLLYGINVNGYFGVIYSPFGLACGWELTQCPYCKGIDSIDALALGVNILAYALLH